MLAEGSRKCTGISWPCTSVTCSKVTLPSGSKASSSACVSRCCANARREMPGIAAVAAATWSSSRRESTRARYVTVIDSSPTIVEPSSSVQVNTTGPDSAALNLNWM